MQLLFLVMTRKVLLSLLLTFFTAIGCYAQREQDFASRFMALYAEGTSLQCTTVSPLMLERMMRLPNVESDSQTRQVLSQLKSIRMVHNTADNETSPLYNKALKLATRNAARYKLYAQRQSKRLYVRRRGRYIVEMVLFMKHDRHLQLINLTGNMTDSFLKQLFNM